MATKLSLLLAPPHLVYEKTKSQDSSWYKSYGTELRGSCGSHVTRTDIRFVKENTLEKRFLTLHQKHIRNLQWIDFHLFANLQEIRAANNFKLSSVHGLGWCEKAVTNTNPNGVMVVKLTLEFQSFILEAVIWILNL